MRILLLSQWFDPEPTFKGLIFARELAALGHQVEVLTGFPNYPGGQVYPGYHIRPWTRENLDGISVLRVALFPSHDKSSLGRVFNYLSFALSASLLGTLLTRKPDVIYVYHPPATVGLAAAFIGFFRRVPFVFDIQDLWPDSVAVSGMMSNPVVLSILNRCCNLIYRRARQIVVLSPGVQARLQQRGVPADKVEVIYNWCDEASMRPTPPDPELVRRLNLPSGFKVMFAGTMGTAQALDSVLQAAELCLRSLPDVSFIFVGGGVERDRLVAKALERGLSNVIFLPRQPMALMGSILALADVLLVHLRDDELFRITIPSKTQAYLAAGKPILMAVQGDAAALVAESGAGLICEPEDPQALADALARFVQMPPAERLRMGATGSRFYIDHVSLRAGVRRFEAIFRKIFPER